MWEQGRQKESRRSKLLSGSSQHARVELSVNTRRGKTVLTLKTSDTQEVLELVGRLLKLDLQCARVCAIARAATPAVVATPCAAAPGRCATAAVDLLLCFMSPT
jgi:hypothetical protein